LKRHGFFIDLFQLSPIRDPTTKELSRFPNWVSKLKGGEDKRFKKARR
jgi:hypothetical protein